VEKTNFLKSEFSITDISLKGKKPPDEIKVNAKLKELKVLKPINSNIKKMNNVKVEYRIKIFTDCLMISELLREIKLVSDLFKLSS
tara:strand:- start:36 stop:293 length:258 start_codon:yes stop_codon:yes gene_type:complete